MESNPAVNTEGTTPFTAMESLDEQQISDELRGKVLDTFVYDVKGKLGLSWAGIKAVAERMKQQGQPLSVEHVMVEESPDGTRFRAIAICKNLATGEKRTGAAEQKRFYDDAKTREIEFSYVLAVSKAQRNAIRAFLPESVITSSIEEWKDKKAHPEKYAKHVTGAPTK